MDDDDDETNQNMIDVIRLDMKTCVEYRFSYASFL